MARSIYRLIRSLDLFVDRTQTHILQGALKRRQVSNIQITFFTLPVKHVNLLTYPFPDEMCEVQICVVLMYLKARLRCQSPLTAQAYTCYMDMYFMGQSPKMDMCECKQANSKYPFSLGIY